MSVALVRRLFEERRGMAAVELALIAPALFAVFVGLVEVQSGLLQQQKVARAAHMAGLLLSQSRTPEDLSSAAEVVTVARLAMAPFETPLALRLSFFEVADATTARVVWSHGDGLEPLPTGSLVTLEAYGLADGETRSFIVSESAADVELKLLGNVLPTLELREQQVFLSRERRSTDLATTSSGEVTWTMGYDICPHIPIELRALYGCGGSLAEACHNISVFGRWKWWPCHPKPTRAQMCDSLPPEERKYAGCDPAYCASLPPEDAIYAHCP